jgi:hypothetical protein
MINLTTTDKLQVVTGTGGASIDTMTTFLTSNSGTLSSTSTFDPATTLVNAITTATTTDLCAAPGAGIRNVKKIVIRNKHASVTETIKVVLDRSATDTELFAATLLAGEELVCNEGVWFHYDANGGVYGASLLAASDTVEGKVRYATQAEMEAASSAVLAVVPSRVKNHPGVVKAWVRATVSAGAPTMAHQFGVTSVTDAALGIMTVTFSTAFSAVNYAIFVSAERASTAYTVANIRNTNVRNASPGTGSCQAECWDQVATTSNAADPLTWYVATLGDQ